jgi:hypothetical protein
VPVCFTNTRLKGDFNSVAEPHHFYAAPAPGEKFYAAPAPAAPAPAPAPTLLYSKATFLKRTKVYTLFCSYDSVRFLLLKNELNGL